MMIIHILDTAWMVNQFLNPNVEMKSITFSEEWRTLNHGKLLLIILVFFFLYKTDVNFRRTVFDPQTGQDVVLSNEDVDLIKNVMSSRIPDGGYNPYEPWVDWFTGEVMQTPVTGRPEHKRSFIPSRIEAMKGTWENDHVFGFTLNALFS